MQYQRQSTKVVSIRFMPSDAKMLERLGAQSNKASYMKALIRADMEAREVQD